MSSPTQTLSANGLSGQPVSREGLAPGDPGWRGTLGERQYLMKEGEPELPLGHPRNPAGP
jgi:hypothetical protein